MGLPNLLRDTELEKALTSRLDEVMLKIDASLSNEKDMANQISALRASIDNLKTVVATLAERVGKLSSAPASSSSNAGGNASSSCKRQADPAPRAAEKPKPVARTFYAIAVVGNESELIEVSEAKRSTAPFIVTVNGEKGEAKFNPDCAAYALKSPDSRLIPFFEYDIQSNPPSMVVPASTARVQLAEGDKWIMDQRIKIILK